MIRINKTDNRILRLFDKGLTLKRIAQRIGRPNDIDRVMDTLIRNKVPKEKWIKK